MTYKFGVCAGRHTMPVEEYIFGEEINPTDYAGMYASAWEKIPADADEVDLYITGLTAATLAIVAVCQARNISLNAYHYDRDTGEYLCQRVLVYTTCGFCGRRYSAYDSYCGNCGSN